MKRITHGPGSIGTMNNNTRLKVRFNVRVLKDSHHLVLGHLLGWVVVKLNCYRPLLWMDKLIDR